MQYVLTFTLSTAGYRCHAKGCSAAITNRNQTLIDETFSSIEAAREWADQDESEKAGKPTKADFRACQCCKS